MIVDQIAALTSYETAMSLVSGIGLGALSLRLLAMFSRKAVDSLR